MAVVKTDGLDLVVLKQGPKYWFYLHEFVTPIVAVGAEEFRAFIEHPAEGKSVRSNRFTDITDAVLEVKVSGDTVTLTFYTSKGKEVGKVSCQMVALRRAFSELDISDRLRDFERNQDF